MSTQDIDLVESTGGRGGLDWSRALLAPALGFGIYAAAATLQLSLATAQPPEQDFGAWALTVLIALVGVTVSSWVGARAMRSSTEARAGLIVGIVAILGIVVFWAGVPCVFGATAVALGARALRTGHGFHGLAVAATLLGGLAVVAGAVTMVVG